MDFLTLQFNLAKIVQYFTISEAMAELVGKSAPNFTATAVLRQEFSLVSLKDYHGKYLVLFFYPMDL